VGKSDSDAAFALHGFSFMFQGRIRSPASSLAARVPRAATQSYKTKEMGSERLCDIFVQCRLQIDGINGEHFHVLLMWLEDHFGSGSVLQRNERVKLAASFWNNIGLPWSLVG
jgi:hypothetical protein